MSIGLLGRMTMVSHKLDDLRIMLRHRRDTAIKRILGSPKIGGRTTVAVIKREKMEHRMSSDIFCV